MKLKRRNDFSVSCLLLSSIISTEALSADTIKTTELYSQGRSTIVALSADGSVLAGAFDSDTDYNVRAFRGTVERGITDLGSLRSDNGGQSSSYALSADGSVVAGRASDNSNQIRAFRWTAGEGMTDLGTLRSDNTGNSSANALSVDGRVVAGDALNNADKTRAFRWTAETGMTDLGTLHSDDDGYSSANALSADGSVVAGRASDDSNQIRAFRWTAEEGMTDLGTLRSDNTGHSSADALSVDGRVAAGESSSDAYNARAFRWTAESGMTDLGTLRSDNSGQSSAFALSADGSVVAGRASNDNLEYRAFRWTAESGMTDLGTLRSDNRGSSTAYAVSADGNVIAGWAENNEGDSRAALWKTSPSLTGFNLVDVDNARKARYQLASDTFQVMELQRLALTQLRERCKTRIQGELCLSADTDYSSVNHNSDLTIGLKLGYALADNVSAGINLGRSLVRDLPGSYRNNNQGVGVGIWTEWNKPGNSGEWYLSLSASTNKYKTEVSTFDYGYADSGYGTLDMKGLGISVEAGREIRLQSGSAFRIYTGVSREEVTRENYTDSRNAFPFSYDEIRYKTNYAFAGLGADIPVTQRLTWINNVRVEQNLGKDNPVFSASAPYIGTIHTTADIQSTRWHTNSGVAYKLANSTTLQLLPYVGQQSQGEVVYGGNISLTARF